ncbi:MAG: hypothetical protein LBM92_08680 [Opitutaceae bacterium]|jgi:hypothetical protein|nr:hypothetical protein [Opitutaceae bacterium]
MRRAYIPATALLLAVFAFFFWRDHTASTERETAAAAQRQREEETALAQKEAETRRAREDAARREAEREAARVKQDAERDAKWRADSDKLAAETAGFSEKAKTQAAQLAAREKKLRGLLEEKQTRRAALFEGEKEVEALSIRRRNAELETLRANQIIAARAASSAAIIPAPLPAPPAPAR